MDGTKFLSVDAQNPRARSTAQILASEASPCSEHKLCAFVQEDGSVGTTFFKVRRKLHRGALEKRAKVWQSGNLPDSSAETDDVFPSPHASLGCPRQASSEQACRKSAVGHFMTGSCVNLDEDLNGSARRLQAAFEDSEKNEKTGISILTDNFPDVVIPENGARERSPLGEIHTHLNGNDRVEFLTACASLAGAAAGL